MPMSRYNRENPFMYVLETKYEELERKFNEMLKNMILMDIMFFISVILSSVNMLIGNRTCIMDILITIALGIIITNDVINRAALLKRKNQELNDIIYSDQYQYVNLNNEKLLAEINHVNQSIGEVISLRGVIDALMIVYGVFIALYIVMLF